MYVAVSETLLRIRNVNQKLPYKYQDYSRMKARCQRALFLISTKTEKIRIENIWTFW